jgi:hypothetical protein
MRPITERIKGGYALELRSKIDSGLLQIDHQHYSNILYRQSDLIDTCASKGEQYLRSRLFENHIPKPSKQCLGQNCATCQESACRKFREFCEGTFNSHSGIFWGEYRTRYSSDFFPLNIFEREAAFLEDKKKYFVEWCELMITLSQISKDRWSLK